MYPLRRKSDQLIINHCYKLKVDPETFIDSAISSYLKILEYKAKGYSIQAVMEKIALIKMEEITA